MTSRKLALNVVVRPGSTAHVAYHARLGLAAPQSLQETAIAPGFTPRPELDLTYHGGHTIADLVFANYYLGGRDRWAAGDRSNIDAALAAAMSDADLNNVMAQYFKSPVTSRMLPSGLINDAVGDRFFKDDVEATVTRLVQNSPLNGADPTSTVMCLLLPRGVILVDGRSADAPADATGGPASGARSPQPRLRDDEQIDSTHGLGGYHGSVDVSGTRYYYAIAVHSEGNNGIPVFDQPWKNAVGVLYHELSEARTDADVEVVNSTGDDSLLGWYSEQGGEVGDIPVSTAPDLTEVFREVPVTDGSGTVPVQFEWSNVVHGPEGPIPQPHEHPAVPTP